MGEANIRYARGEKDDAVLMCMEIIRQGASGLYHSEYTQMGCSDLIGRKVSRLPVSRFT